MSALSTTRRQEAAAMISFEERLLEDKEEYMESIFHIPIVIEAQELNRKLNTKRFDISIRIKDGSFKYTERIDETQAEKTQIKKIETVYNGAPVQSVWQRLKRSIKGDFSGKK